MKYWIGNNRLSNKKNSNLIKNINLLKIGDIWGNIIINILKIIKKE